MRGKIKREDRIEKEREALNGDMTTMSRKDICLY